MIEDKLQWSVLDKDLYTARLQRVAILGTQYDAYSGTTGVRASLSFEVSGQENRLMNQEGEVFSSKPTVVFKEFNIIPGETKGAVFSIYKSFDNELTEVPSDLNWFFNHVGNPVALYITQYVSKKGGLRNRVLQSYPIPSNLKEFIPPMIGRSTTFNCYEYNMKDYELLIPFQKQILTRSTDIISSKYLPNSFIEKTS